MKNENQDDSRMSWEWEAVQEVIHMWVLTLDRTIFYGYQPKYITECAFKEIKKSKYLNKK